MGLVDVILRRPNPADQSVPSPTIESQLAALLNVHQVIICPHLINDKPTGQANIWLFNGSGFFKIQDLALDLELSNDAREMASRIRRSLNNHRE